MNINTYEPIIKMVQRLGHRVHLLSHTNSADYADLHPTVRLKVSQENYFTAV